MEEKPNAVSPEAIKKKGFWALIPNKKQFVLGVLIYLLGLSLALLGSSTKSLAITAQARVTSAALSSNGENVYIISYAFETAKGKNVLDSYTLWTLTPEEDLPVIGEKFDVNYLPFLPTMTGTEQTWSFVMFTGIVLFFAGWTMTKGRAPIVQTKKKKPGKEYYYSSEEDTSSQTKVLPADIPEKENLPHESDMKPNNDKTDKD